MEDVITKKFEQDRSIIKNLPPFTIEEFQEVREDVIKYFEERPKVKNFMLLSNELRYYTIFQRSNALVTASGYADRILTFLNNDSFFKGIGRIKSFKKNWRR